MKKIIVLASLLFVVFAIAQQVKPKVATKHVVQASAANNGAGSVARGKLVYEKNCLSCHQADGGGVPHLNPPLAECSWSVGDKKRIINIVLHGMSDRVPIDDEYYSNSMMPHNNLTDQQIADVLTYIRQSFGNKASALTALEVKAVRGITKKK